MENSNLHDTITIIVLTIVATIAILGYVMVQYRLIKERKKVYELKSNSFKYMSRINSLGFDSFVSLIEEQNFIPISPITVKTHLRNNLYDIEMASGITSITSCIDPKSILNLEHCTYMFDALKGSETYNKYQSYLYLSFTDKTKAYPVNIFTNAAKRSKTVFLVREDADCSDLSFDHIPNIEEQPIIYVTKYKDDCPAFGNVVIDNANKLICSRELIPSLKNFIVKHFDMKVKDLNNSDLFKLKRIEHTNLFILYYRREVSSDFRTAFLRIE